VKNKKIDMITTILNLLKKLDFKTLLILALVVVVLLMRMCGNKPEPKKGDTVKIDGKKYEVLKHEIDTEYVKVTQTVVKQGKDIIHDVPVYVNVPVNVDTNAILKDYYAKYCIKDTLKLKDSLGWVSIKDTVFKNKIVNRVWSSNVNKMIVKETLIVKELPRNQVYFGGVMGFDKANIINFAGPSAMLKTKTDKVYTLGVGYSNAKTVAVQGGMYWKIKLKK
jgi:hypothetical protein